MKRYILALVVLLLGLPLRSFAQTSAEPIILNDAIPGIDVVVSTPPGTSGVVALQLSGSAVNVTDASGAAVFETGDARVHGLELHFAPGAVTHTVTAQRLTTISEAYVTAASQTDLTSVGALTQVTSPTLADGQEFDAPLSAASASQVIDLNIAAYTFGRLSASFPATPVTAQLVDSAGVTVATLYAGQIDGFSLLLEAGTYQLTLLNADTSRSTVAAVSLTSSPAPDLPAPLPLDTTVQANNPAPAAAPVSASCSVQISSSSTTLRSGPGEGYSVIGYLFRDQTLQVGGMNTEQNWLLVSDGATSAWMDRVAGLTSGDCSVLTTFDIPFRPAEPPQIIVQPSQGTFFGEEHEDDDHESEEHEEHEEGDDD